MASYLDNADLERSILSGDREALGAQLLLLADRVVRGWATMLPPSVEFEDVIQQGAVDALRRLDGWDRSKGGSAFAYATESVKFTVRDAMKAGHRRAKRFRALAEAEAATI